MIEIIVTAMVCGTVLYVAKLFFPLMKRTVDTHSASTSVPAPLPQIPADLLMHATQWRDPWAREQALKSIYDMYESAGSWDRVRFLMSQDINQ